MVCSNCSNTRNLRLLKIEEPPRPPARKHRSRWSGRAFQGRILGRPDPTRSVSSSFTGARDCAQKLVRAQEELACVGTGPNSPHIPFNSFVFLPLHHRCDRVGSFSRIFMFFSHWEFIVFRVHAIIQSCCSSCFVWAVHTYTYIFSPILKKRAAACISRDLFFVFISRYFHLANRSSLSLSGCILRKESRRRRGSSWTFRDLGLSKVSLSPDPSLVIGRGPKRGAVMISSSKLKSIDFYRWEPFSVFLLLPPRPYILWLDTPALAICGLKSLAAKSCRGKRKLLAAKRRSRARFGLSLIWHAWCIRGRGGSTKHWHRSTHCSWCATFEEGEWIHGNFLCFSCWGLLSPRQHFPALSELDFPDLLHLRTLKDPLGLYALDVCFT